MSKPTKVLIFPLVILIVLLAYIFPVFSAENDDNLAPRIYPNFDPEAYKKWKEEKQKKEVQEAKKALEYSLKELEREQKHDYLKNVFSEIVCERYSKDQTVKHWIPVSLEVIVFCEGEIKVLFPKTKNNTLVLEKWTNEDFDKCIAVLKKQYEKLPEGEAKTMLIEGVFSRFPRVEVKFPYEEALKIRIDFLRIFIQDNEDPERFYVVSK